MPKKQRFQKYRASVYNELWLHYFLKTKSIASELIFNSKQTSLYHINTVRFMLMPFLYPSCDNTGEYKCE